MRCAIVIACALVVASCGPPDPCPDGDGDGWDASECGGGDCDDDRADVHPSAEEVCADGLDNNCDGRPGPCGLSGTVAVADAGLTLLGTNSSDLLGNGLAGHVSLGSSPVPALAVGAPGVEQLNGLPVSGVVYVLDAGSFEGTDPLQADAILYAGSGGPSNLGRPLKGATDLDGDGQTDLIVSNQVDSDGGIGYVIRGPVETGETALSNSDASYRGTAWTTAACQEEPAFLSFLFYIDYGFEAADLTGDGLPDIVFAEAGEALRDGPGSVYVFSWPVDGEFGPESAAATVVGDTVCSATGWSVGATGDLDDDGQTDLAVGAPLEPGADGASGAVYVVHGPLAGDIPASTADSTIRSPYPELGRVVVTPGDVTGDGVDDLLILAERTHGVSYVFAGPLPSGDLDTAAADATIGWVEGSGSSEPRITNASSAGDVNGDGVADLLLTTKVDDAYQVRLIYGPVVGTRDLAEADAVFVGDWPLEYFPAVGVGDLNADGYGDIGIGNPRSDVNGAESGAAYIFFGRPTPL